MACHVTVKVEPSDVRGLRKLRRGYSYICPFDDVAIGDRVLVPFGGENWLVRGKVVELDPPETIKRMATKWVAARVDEKVHAMRMALGVPGLETEGDPQ